MSAELTNPMILTAIQTSIACPERWIGRLDDGWFYVFRYRWGVVALGIGADEATASERCMYQDYNSAAERVGDHLDGVFAGPAERCASFARLFERIGW